MFAVDDLDLRLPARIVCGVGRRREVGVLARSLGRRAFLVHGSRTLAAHGVFEELAEALSESGVDVISSVPARREPMVEDVDWAVDELSEFGPGEGDLVIAVGGGAAIDLGKAIAALAPVGEVCSVRDYLEGIGQGRTLSRTPLPILAIPTTGGTGSEATRNAVIACHDPPCKKSLRHDGLMPRVVLIDPELAVHAPPDVTAHSGMDAITQLIESYVTRRANAVTRRLCIEGLRLALPALPVAFETGHSVPARTAMAEAALLSGIALANSGLGMAHGVAAALGAQCGVPHGLACAVMLPVAMRTNLSARPSEFDSLSHELGFPTAIELIGAVESLCRQLGIPDKLAALGVVREQLSALAVGSRGNSMDGNPRAMTDDELAHILEAAL